MDPLSALSLAANIIQFVNFTFDLLNSTHKVHNSISGASDHSLDLENVHTKLLEFSAQLRDGASPSPSLGARIRGTQNESKYGPGLKETAEACGKDCGRLLEIVGKLKAKSGTERRWWQSFSKAILEVWTAKDVERLKARTDEHQKLMILKLCATSVETIRRSSSDLQQLRREAWSAHRVMTRQFFHLKDSLENVYRQVEIIATKVADLTSNNVRREIEPSEIEILTTKVSAMSFLQQNFVKQNTVLSSLDYPRRVQRHEDIPEAHHDTFRWIFSDLEESKSTKFVDWIERGDGVFWISGRPGSGKSTLMKLLVDSLITRENLFRWATPKSIVIASHFFWSAGLPIQRSQEGLLRSLLHSLLHQIPDLAVSIYEEWWNESDISALSQRRWSQTELEGLLHKVIQLHKLPIKFAFFVDRLDEFQGDGCSSISQLMLDLGRCTDIKLCVSSRPWNIFEDAFGRDSTRKIYVHELTKADIRKYAECKLFEHPRWLDSSSSDLKLMENLASEITERAQGVFLWVFLVTRLLGQGISDYDSAVDLWKRLQSIPVDLERFFKHILYSVEPFYHEKMAGTLLIALRAGEPLPIELYYFHQLEYDDKEYALKQPIRCISEQEFEPLNGVTSRRLNGWCKGLVETRHGRVEFLHRTVRDFLRTASMNSLLEAKALSTFHPCFSLLRAQLAWIKSSMLVDQSLRSRQAGTLETALCRVFRYAKELDEENKYQDSCETHLNDLENSVQTMIGSGQLRVLHSKTTTKDIRLFFRQCIMTQDLGTYLSRKLKCDAEYFEDFDQPPLSILLTTWVWRLNDKCSGEWDSRSVPIRDCQQVLQCLLEHRESPNEPMIDEHLEKTRTPWHDFTSLILCLLHPYRPRPKFETGADVFIHVLESGILNLLLDHGADPNVCNDPSKGVQHVTPFWINWLFQAFCLDSLWKHYDSYLRVLKNIFKSGANFKLMLDSVSDISKGTFWMCLCAKLQKLALEHESGHTIEGPRLQFLVQVIVEFAKAANKVLFNWDEMVPSLRRLFSQPQLREIFLAMGKGADRETLRLRKRYRVPDQGESDFHDAKKRKVMDNGDES